MLGRHQPSRRSLLAALLLTVGLGLAPAASAAQGGAGAASAGPAIGSQLVLRTLSNRADLVSGGDVLVEVARTDGQPVAGLHVTVNGHDTSPSFAARPDGRVEGLLTGLVVGANVVEATADAATGARLVVTNHPIGGPVFSGAQIQPWACSTDRNGLGPAVDAQCNAPAVQRWRYRTTGGSYADYDVTNPPTDVATTTTDAGQTVPYVFLLETGAMNRGIYRFAILADPAQPLRPWLPSRGWNRSVYYKFGPSCGTTYGQGDPSESVEDNRALSPGYAVATSSLSVLGSDCNTVTSAESLMMLQEHLVELFGPISHTRGKGGSGGSIGQFVTPSGYPGLLQGLNVDMAFEDFWTTLTEVADCHLLLHYFTQTSPHLWADARAQGLVTGHLSTASCAAWEVAFAPLLDPNEAAARGRRTTRWRAPPAAAAPSRTCRSTCSAGGRPRCGRRPKRPRGTALPSSPTTTPDACTASTPCGPATSPPSSSST